MTIDRLVVASKNPDKIAEVEAVLRSASLVGEIVRGLDWPDVDEVAETLEGNALLKARAVAAETGLPAVADDTGLFVAALDGAPGIYAARYAGPGATYADNVRLLLDRMAGQKDRAAEFRTAAALVWPPDAQGSEHAEDIVAFGVLAGIIIDEPRGESGFGYDPVFEVGGRTLAEIPPDEKNRMSHRARALGALVEALRVHPAG